MIVTAVLFSLLFVRCGASDNDIDIRDTLSKLKTEIRSEMHDTINQEVALLRKEIHELRLRIPVQSAPASDEHNRPRNRKAENMSCTTSIEGTDFIFDGCNVSIRNGAGETATENGLGNVILGYNEVDDNRKRHVRTGSHTVVIGPSHSYSGYGGLVVGSGNVLAEKYASVFGGKNNAANGSFSSVVGGSDNIADGSYSLVLGGDNNWAKSTLSAILGGRDNKAKGKFSVISGGNGITVNDKFGYENGEPPVQPLTHPPTRAPAPSPTRSPIKGSTLSPTNESTTLSPAPPFTFPPSLTPATTAQILMKLYNNADGDNWTDNTNWGKTSDPCDWYGISCNDAGGLYKINLGSNGLSGSIPTEVGMLTQLTHIYLHQNALKCPIPTEIGELTKLSVLNLWSNFNVNEGIPTELGKLTQLTYLFLSNNALTGTIPTELGRLDQVTRLQLSNNQLTGTIPSEIGMLNQLTDLWLYFNTLNGSIPDEICDLEVETLYVDDDIEECT